jgi:hypothetical protein
MSAPAWNHNWVDVWGDDTPPESYYGFRDRNVLQKYVDALNERTLIFCQMQNSDYDATKLVMPVDDPTLDGFAHAADTAMYYVWLNAGAGYGIQARSQQGPFNKSYEPRSLILPPVRSTYMDLGNVWAENAPDVLVNDNWPNELTDYHYQIMRLINSLADTDHDTDDAALFVGSSAVTGNAPYTGKILQKQGDGTWLLHPTRNDLPVDANYGFPDLKTYNLGDTSEPDSPDTVPNSGKPNDAVANDYWLNKMRDRVNASVLYAVGPSAVSDPDHECWFDVEDHTNQGGCPGFELGSDGNIVFDGDGNPTPVTTEARAKAIAEAQFNSGNYVDGANSLNDGFGGPNHAVANIAGNLSPGVALRVTGPGSYFNPTTGVTSPTYTASIFRASYKVIVRNPPSAFAAEVFIAAQGLGTDSTSYNDGTPDDPYHLTNFGDDVYDCLAAPGAPGVSTNGYTKTIIHAAGVIGPGDWTSAQISDHLTLPTPWPSLAANITDINRGYCWVFGPFGTAAGDFVSLNAMTVWLRYDGTGGFNYTFDRDGPP